MPQLLLEIFSEEIPARMQGGAGRDLERLVGERLKAAGLTWDAMTAYAGPRRLTLVVEGLPEATPDREEEIKGPKISAPEQALEGFLRKTGLTREQLVERDGVLFAIQSSKGRQTTDVLWDCIWPVLLNFPWPKTMKWGPAIEWIRPIRRIICLFDGKVVPGGVGGAGGIEFGDATEGHRFLGTGRPLKVRDFADYRRQLEDNFVLLDAADRRLRILEQARAVCHDKGLALVDDDGLLDEVAGLAEWPTPILGDMDPQFLDLPPEVVRLSMKVHQKYFAVRDPGKDGLAPNFVVVANVEASDGGKALAAGNSRVLSARLNDARFFWDEDRKAGNFDGWLKKLEGVTFHARLGTMAERVERIAALARELAPLVGADPDQAEKAARFAKADLASGMVGEFPELQGIMGGYYLREASEDPAIADAVRDHYKPQGPNDTVPTAPLTVAVALADKLDTLVGFFAIDEKPTGSKDPFALRRAALGVIRLVLENEFRLGMSAAFVASIRQLIAQQYEALNQITDQMSDVYSIGSALSRAKALPFAREMLDGVEEVEAMLDGFADEYDFDENLIKQTATYNRLMAFMMTAFEERGRSNPSRAHQYAEAIGIATPPVAKAFMARVFGQYAQALRLFAVDRLQVLLREQGRRHDLVSAVFELGDDDLVRIVRRVEALSDFLATEDGVNLLAGYKRASNILRAEEKKGPLPEGAVATGLAGQPSEETALAFAVAAASTEVDGALEREDFSGAMAALARLRAPVDAFFEAVLVNSDVAAERENRLKLLGQVRSVMGRVADFGQVAG